jgi:hypothetical protein
MLIIKYNYSNKVFNIEPYTTEQERQILLLDLLGSTDRINGALRILNMSDDDIDSLTDTEKVALLFKYRSVSIGHEIPVAYKCIHCLTPNETNLDIDVLVTDSPANDKFIDQFKDVTEENLGEFLKFDVDELDLDEFDQTLKDVKNSVTKFNFIKSNNCIKCKEPNFINIEEDVMDYMSEDTILTMYQTYNDLTYFGSYSKLDIDSLYPFERTILIGLLNKTKEELNK